jgi:hypothetical protein
MAVGAAKVGEFHDWNPVGIPIVKMWLSHWNALVHDS